MTAHILSDAARRSISGIEAYVHVHRPTLMFISPQMLKLLNLENTSLRAVLCGGERMRNLEGRSYRLFNGYGSSETAGLALFFPVDRKYSNTPIGRPAHGLKFRLTDALGNDVPRGEEGELCIIGRIASGYINLPEETATAFVFRPDGTTLLRTGDICRMQEDGNLIYINRGDWMVKINGQRVETGEIEQVMAEHPDVEASVVKSFTNAHGQTYLCGYYTEKKPCAAEALRSHLRGRLPDYMVPQQLVRLDKMPLNANGKLDRKRLTAPDIQQQARKIIPPANDAQEKICAAFSEVLKIGRISIDDDFFALGGDSLQLMMLITALPGLTAEDVHRNRTPEQLALVWRYADAAAQTADGSIFSNPFDEQGRMRILDGMRYYKKTAEENNMTRSVIRMKDPIDEACLQYAAEKAFERFRVFRFTVVGDDARFYLKENKRKPVVRKLVPGERLCACGEENNDHLTLIAYHGSEIIFEMFHGVSDGQGSLPFSQVLICAYCEKNTASTNPETRAASWQKRLKIPANTHPACSSCRKKTRFPERASAAAKPSRFPAGRWNPAFRASAMSCGRTRTRWMLICAGMKAAGPPYSRCF